MYCVILVSHSFFNNASVFFSIYIRLCTFIICLKSSNDLGAILLCTLNTFNTDMGPCDFKQTDPEVYVFIYLLFIYLHVENFDTFC
jgi:hypothetical protein